MPIAPHDNAAVDPGSDFSQIEIFAVRGMNTTENPLSLNNEEMTNFVNWMLKPRHMIRRLGSALFGTDPGGTKVQGIGHLEQDSGTTLLFLNSLGDLYKYSAGWTVSDKTTYDVTNDANIVTFTSKNGNSVVNGTSSSGTTKYLVEDASKTWVPGAYKGMCVVIRGETKYILDNTVTVLFLSDRLNNELDSYYQSQTYDIYAIDPMAFIANGVDFVQKYNLTTHVPLDGTHVTSGEPVPKFRYLAVHQGRLWGARGSGDDNDRVFISDVGVGEQYTKDTNLNVNLSFQNDGDEVTGIASLPLRSGSVLIVAKNESVHSVEGDNVLNYVVHVKFTKGGCIAPKTLKVAGRSAFMLSLDGVLRFSGDGASDLLDSPIPISEAISNEIAAFSLADRRAACAEVCDNKYFLGIGSTLFMYDIVESIRREQHIWSKLSFPWSFNYLHAAGGVLYAGSSTTGQVYQLFTGNDDNGTRITATMETSEISFPGGAAGYVDRLEIMASENSDVVLRLAVAVDGGSYGSYITCTLDQDLGIYRFPIKERGSKFKFKFIDNWTGTPVQIAMPIRILYSVGSFGARETKADFAS